MADSFSTNRAAQIEGEVRPAPPSAGQGRWRFKERLFSLVLAASGAVILLIVAGILVSLVFGSVPSLKAYGFAFLAGDVWDPNTAQYGALPFIVGTLLTSFLALGISLPFSFSLSVLLGEYSRKGAFSSVIRTMMELLAGIPSVVYGLAGAFFLIPAMQSVEMELGVAPYGVGVLSASLVLSVMIIPYAATLGKEVLELVPGELKEGAYALGATRFEVVTRVSVPYSFSGIIAGVILSLGRALGETIAVTMLIGNLNGIPENIFAPGQTIASLIANQFNEAGNEMHRSALLELGLVLLLITAVVNILGKAIVNKMSVKGKP
jgi:phosphate transport system permease protein